VNNTHEMRRWLQDAETCLRSAERTLVLNDYRVVVQNAQLAIEMSAKAVIAYFAEPLWHHDPSPQIRRLLNRHAESLARIIGIETRDRLETLAEDAEEAAPWHAWSTYGREDAEAGWLSAADLCTEVVAEDLLLRARRACETARAFWIGMSSPPEDLPRGDEEV